MRPSAIPNPTSRRSSSTSTSTPSAAQPGAAVSRARRTGEQTMASIFRVCAQSASRSACRTPFGVRSMSLVPA